MPTYIYTAPNGKKVSVQGDTAPTPAQLEVIFKRAGLLPETPAVPPRTWTDTAVDALPMIGGAVGGIATGVAGGLPTFGVGAGPGAIIGATVGGGAGEALRETINRFRDKPAPGTSLQAAKDIGKQGAIQGALEAGGQLAMKGLAAGGRALYRGYLKPSLSQRLLPQADEIVETAVSEGLPVTKGGVQRAESLIGELKNEVDDILKRTSGTVDLHDVAEKVRAFAKRSYYRPGADLSDYEAALRVADRLDLHPSLGVRAGSNAPVSVSLSRANAAKRALDESIRDTGFGIKTGAEKTTEKVARATLRKEIESVSKAGGAVTETGESLIGALNARERRLIPVARSLTRAVAREANKSPAIGVNTLVSGAVGLNEYRRTGDPVAAAVKALALRMALTPAVATRAALVAVRLGKVSGSAPATLARVAIQAALEAEQAPEDGAQHD